MMRVFALAALLAAALVRTCLASCGASTCPLPAAGHRSGASRFAFELSYQLIDQDRARIGTERASIGEIPSPEDEIRTRTRLIFLRGDARVTGRLSLTTTFPIVDRFHRHRSNEGEEAGETFEWSYAGLGDLALLGHWAVIGGEEARLSLTLQAGVKLPTGRRHVTPVGGEEPEPPARPGTGSTDGMAGVHLMRWFAVRTPWGEPAQMRTFGSALVRVNGRGTEDYRVGTVFEASAGARYPLSRRLELTFGLDSRIAGKDAVGETDATRDNTGGAWVFAAPGLRLRLAGLLALHGAVQLPVYERVNGIQIVAPRNFVAGLIYSLD